MTTTVTTVTTTVTTMGMGVTMGIAVTLALILLLVSRELAGSGHGTAASWQRSSAVAIVPLVLSFAVIVAVKVAGL